MRIRFLAALTILLATGLMIGPGSSGCGKVSAGSLRQDRVASDLQAVSFSLTRVPDKPRQYSLVLSDEDEHNISGNFSIEQLQILRTIMVEAEKFALSGEAAGTKDPVTTRFMDKQEIAFIVDVEKLGPRSNLYLTIRTEIGRITLNAGRIIRTTRREEGFFFDLLTQLESQLPKLPSK